MRHPIETLSEYEMKKKRALKLRENDQTLPSITVEFILSNKKISQGTKIGSEIKI